MYIEVSGSYVIPLSALKGNFAEENLYLLVDTSGGECDITIPELSEIGTLQPKIFIQDVTGTATDANITIAVSGSDTINGTESEILITENYGCAIIEASSLTNFVAEIVNAGQSGQLVLIDTIQFPAVNAGAAATTYTSTKVASKPIGKYFKDYFITVQAPFATVSGLYPHMVSIFPVLAATSDEVDFNVTGRKIFGNTLAVSQNSDQAMNIKTTIGFGNGSVNPKNYTNGGIRVWGVLYDFPSL